MIDKKIEANTLDPILAAEASWKEISLILPPLGNGVSTMEKAILYQGSVIVAMRILYADLHFRQRWELYLISGKEPVAERLALVDAPVLLLRKIGVTCQLSGHGSLLAEEVNVKITVPASMADPRYPAPQFRVYIKK